MPTLYDDLEELDRLIDGSARKDEIRSQLRVVQNGVVTLHTQYTSLDKEHAEFVTEAAKAKAEVQEAHAKEVTGLKEQNAELVAANAALVEKNSELEHELSRFQLQHPLPNLQFAADSLEVKFLAALGRTRME